MRSPWLLFPFSALNAAALMLWESREWTGTCVDYVDRPGQCSTSSVYIAWSDTLKLALVVLVLSLVATLVRWHRDPRRPPR
jgi:hypothetical protein